MQAITTKFLPPTNNRCSRYKASCDAGSLVLSADLQLSYEENHMRVARRLLHRLGWFHEPSRGDRYGKWYIGALESGGYVVVCAGQYEEVRPDPRGAAPLDGDR